MLRTLAKKPLQPDQQSTRGVSVDAFADDLKPKFGDKWRHGFDLELSFWDFAGQLEYSAAHEFFMSTRQSVYVIVYSVLDDDESTMQQLLHWLSVIPEFAASPHMRLMIVGTKIDMVPYSELKGVLRCKRGVVLQVVEAKGLVHKIRQPDDVLFVSSLQSFESPGLNMTWASCRRGLKLRIYDNCVDVFACQDARQLQLLKYPKPCIEMKNLVEKLRKELKKKQTLPCCRLDHVDAISILSKILDSNDKDQRKSYYKTDLVIMALDILDDLGIIVRYGGDGSLNVSESASSVPCICLQPQFLPGIMSLLVDPQTLLPAVTTIDALMHLMENNTDVSFISKASPIELKHQLIQLLESVGIVRRYGDSQKLLVPLALRGRPVCWSQIIHGRSNALLLGWRLGVSPTASVPAASFMQLMLDKCTDAERMWGCAFAYDVPSHQDGGASSTIYVRLREDRRSVDVVAVMDEGHSSDNVARQELDGISRLLGKDFNGANERMHLCPMCCSADMFVRCGSVHAFHNQEVTAGIALHCSRYHDVTATDVTRGKLTKLDTGPLPFVYPSRFHELQLPWQRVAAGGIINNSASAQNLPVSSDDAARSALGTLALQAAASLPVQPVLPFLGRRLASSAPSPGFSRTSHLLDAADCSSEVGADAVFDTDATVASTAADTQRDAFADGTFTDVSFFVLTGQVSAGDVIAAEDLPEFMRQLDMCSSRDCQCHVKLSSGQRKMLHFSYTVGQRIPNTFCDQPIASIFPANIGDRAQHPQAPRLPRFCAHDNVLVLFGPVQRHTKFLVFPGSSMNLQLCRLTPALCQNDLTAACCWSELQVRIGRSCAFVVQAERAHHSRQDQFSVVMGLEFDMYEITALTLMRNDARAESFTANLQELEQRAQTLPLSPHWHKTPHDIVRSICPKRLHCFCAQRICGAGCCSECRVRGLQGGHRAVWHRRRASGRHGRR
jgi:GTPase SAR1 family protein